ncbi:MAG: carbohydrate kinase [Chitinophagaceae bacterium]|nr:MAG: carbohydrate kinase [Chitinophagaceae bacterium]
MRNLYDAVCFGETLWDLLPTGARPGGAPMNVAYHLQKQGLQAALISRVGNDERGKNLLQILEQNGVATAFVQTDSEQPTGVVNATLHESNEVSYEIVAPVAWDFIAWEKSLTQVVEESRFFIYGSLAARNPVTANTLWRLVEAAQVNVVDINLRPPYFSRELVEKLLHHADILKLNEHELALVSSWLNKESATKNQLQNLQNHFSIPTIIVTQGGSGATVCHEGEIFSHPGYAVKVVDTIGSGDAFLAAFLAKTSAGAPISECLQAANALGAFIASKEGACPEYEPHGPLSSA